MSVNTPPNPNVSTFNPLYWIVDGVNLTGYLKFPTGQGTETLPGLIVSGTTTLTGATTSSALITTTDLKVNNTQLHLGQNAGLTTQGSESIAIGRNAGQNSQGASSVAIGYNAGQTTLGTNAIAIGINSASTGTHSIAIGNAATSGGFNASVAIGILATCTSTNQIRLGTATQDVSHPGTTTLTGATTSSALITTTDLIVNNTQLHLGTSAGLTNQGASAVAIGNLAGVNNQGASAVAIGILAGRDNQQGSTIAIGSSAGQTNQGGSSIAIGLNAGTSSLGDNSIAIGLSSVGTGANSVAIGNAANTSTFSESVAIGKSATSTAANQITLGTTASSYRLAGVYLNNWVSYQNISQVITASTGTALLLTTTNNAGNCGITYNNTTGVFTNSNAYSVVCIISLAVFFPATATGRRIIQITTSTTGSRAYGAVEQTAGGAVANDSMTTSVNLLLASGQTFTPTAFQDTTASITIGRANNPNDLSMIVW